MKNKKICMACILFKAVARIKRAQFLMFGSNIKEKNFEMLSLCNFINNAEDVDQICIIGVIFANFGLLLVLASGRICSTSKNSIIIVQSFINKENNNLATTEESSSNQGLKS